jgi:SAM-dependent methyltransferase
LIHVCWIAAGHAWIAYLAREIDLAPDDVYSYESFTAPEFRGSNIAAARSVYMQQTLYDAGYRRAVAVVMPENRSAYRAVEKAGYRRIGMLRTIWIGKWRRHFGRVAASRSINSAYWDDVAGHTPERSPYLDPFLGNLKRQTHLDLIARWGSAPETNGVPGSGRVLKTDLFEEATGPDAFLWNLAETAARVNGMDISPALAAAARRRDPDRRAHYLVADARQLPFATESFDLIVSPSTLDHFVDPADLGRSLRELRRILTTSGQLIVTLDNRQNIFDPLLRLIDRLGLIPYYMGRSYSIAELRAELQAADLEVIDTTAILHNPRLVATAGVALANRLGWKPLIRLVQRALIAAQRLEHSRWRYRTGSFIAARARRKRPAA